MKTYVYKYVNNVTNSYHDGGAVLIITDGDPQAEWAEYRNNRVSHGEEWEDWEKLTDKLPEPDMQYGCDADFKGVWVFEDSGCC